MPELSVIVPTLNERENVEPLVKALKIALGGVEFEVIFVDDDSSDGTAAKARQFAQLDSTVRVVQRIRRRGLSSAVVEGMLASSAPYLAVIDGDMQHDESLLPEMLARLKRGGLDLVVGTRNTAGGSMGELSASRIALSQTGRKLSAVVCRADLSDPMSGFFMVTRAYLDEVVHSLSTVGFKILLDLVASSRRPVRFEEVGYTFRKRLRGESKLDLLVGLEYMELLIDKAVGEWIPVRYTLFAMVGAVGVVAQLALIYAMMRLSTLSFLTAQVYSSVLVIALNFALNNQMTFRSRRLRGWAWVLGLVQFFAACSIGLFSNLKVATSLRDSGLHWAAASMAGIVIGSVWNYCVSSILVWRVNRRR